MEYKTLHPLEAATICLALLGIQPSTKTPGGPSFGIEIDEIKPTQLGEMLGIEIDFHTPWQESGGYWADFKYKLWIAYWDTANQFNPAIISLHKALVENGEPVMEVESLANLTIVADRLVLAGIWEETK